MLVGQDRENSGLEMQVWGGSEQCAHTSVQGGGRRQRSGLGRGVDRPGAVRGAGLFPL